MRKKCHADKRWILFFFICSIVVNWFFMPEFFGENIPFEVSAKVSKSVKRKAARAYREDLYEADYTWFHVMDIDEDGLKELILAYEQYPLSITINKYRKGRTYTVGEESAMWGFRYHKKTKRIYGEWANRGSEEKWNLAINKNGRLKYVSLMSMVQKPMANGKVPYDYYYKGKKVSRKVYLRKRRNWLKNTAPLKMHKTSMRNIRKYVR